jgi:ABC transporter substrate binding protein
LGPLPISVPVSAVLASKRLAVLESKLAVPFRAGLRDLGYEEGRNIIIEYRWADERYERLPALFAEMVRLKVDVIVTHGTPGVLAARQATTTIPVVLPPGRARLAAKPVPSCRENRRGMQPALAGVNGQKTKWRSLRFLLI